METEAYLETYTESGSPLFITIKMNIFQDETIDIGRGSKPFWSYEILKIKAVCRGRNGDTNEIEIDMDEYEDEIKSECRKELLSFTEAA